MGTVTLPLISSGADWVAKQGWFLISDAAGIVAGVTTDVSWITIIAILCLVGSWFILWRTAFGLRLRSCGEAPYAAATLGVKVMRYKYIAVVVSGGLAGLGGAYLAIVAAQIYREGQTAGRGYIGLAAMIFGNWRPGGLAAGAGLFGYTDALQLRGGGAVHALLLLTSIALAGYGVWLLYKRRTIGGVVSIVVAVLVALWYATTDDVPPQVAFVTPYVATLLVLSLASQRLRMPAADGKPYLKGEEH
jgi:simple sugar transport system permease protein